MIVRAGYGSGFIAARTYAASIILLLSYDSFVYFPRLSQEIFLQSLEIIEYTARVGGYRFELLNFVMQRKYWILISLFLGAIVLATGVSFHRYVVEHDYLVEMRVACDPALNRCFMGACDAEAGELCGDDPATTPEEYTYAIIRRNAKYLPACDLNADDCLPPTCGDGEPECEMRFCTDEDTEAGTDCSAPGSAADDLFEEMEGEELRAETDLLSPLEEGQSALEEGKVLRSTEEEGSNLDE